MFFGFFMLAAILFYGGILAFIALGLLADKTLECPDCQGRLVDWTLHNANPEMPVKRCVDCKKEWI